MIQVPFITLLNACLMSELFHYVPLYVASLVLNLQTYIAQTYVLLKSNFKNAKSKHNLLSFVNQ